jgi:hypothetical protein
MFNYVFEDFSQKREFTKAVREAVNDELFWRNLLEKYDLSKKQEKKVKKLVQEQLDQYTNNQIPSHVSKNFSLFLNNNIALNLILREHEEKLRNELTVKAREILDQITNEEQYQQVTTSCLRNMENRFKDELNSQNNSFHEFLLFSEKKINDEISLLKETNKKLEAQETEIRYIKYGLGLTILTGFIYAIFPSPPGYVSF